MKTKQSKTQQSVNGLEKWSNKRTYAKQKCIDRQDQGHAQVVKYDAISRVCFLGETIETKPNKSALETNIPEHTCGV